MYGDSQDPGVHHNTLQTIYLHVEIPPPPNRQEHSHAFPLAHLTPMKAAKTKLKLQVPNVCAAIRMQKDSTCIEVSI